MLLCRVALVKKGGAVESAQGCQQVSLPAFAGVADCFFICLTHQRSEWAAVVCQLLISSDADRSGFGNAVFLRDLH